MLQRARSSRLNGVKRALHDGSSVLLGNWTGVAAIVIQGKGSICFRWRIHPRGCSAVDAEFEQLLHDSVHKCECVWQARQAPLDLQRVSAHLVNETGNGFIVGRGLCAGLLA